MCKRNLEIRTPNRAARTIKSRWIERRVSRETSTRTPSQRMRAPGARVSGCQRVTLTESWTKSGGGDRRRKRANRSPVARANRRSPESVYIYARVYMYIYICMCIHIYIYKNEQHTVGSWCAPLKSVHRTGDRLAFSVFLCRGSHEPGRGVTAAADPRGLSCARNPGNPLGAARAIRQLTRRVGVRLCS